MIELGTSQKCRPDFGGNKGFNIHQVQVGMITFGMRAVSKVSCLCLSDRAHVGAYFPEDAGEAGVFVFSYRKLFLLTIRLEKGAADGKRAVAVGEDAF